MKLIPVNSPQEKALFLSLVDKIYKNDPHFIKPLNKDIESVFNPQKNRLFKNGEAQRWLLLNDQSQAIGRVAAFVNYDLAQKEKQATGGMGFFECIDNKEAAHLLLNACQNWLMDKGMEAMDGPINFGERNFWWGLLIDGFSPPTYGMNYNPAYYRSFFEDFGFQVYFEQTTYGLGMDEKRPEKYFEKARKIFNQPGFSFIHIDKKNLKKFAEDFRSVYNKAWGVHPGFKEMKASTSEAMMAKMKPVLVEDLMWFGYYNNEPIAFFIMLPDLNQYFKHVNGKLNLIGKLKVLYHQKRKSVRKIFGVVFGIVPDFQGKGVEGAMIIAADNHIRPQNRWDEIELTWIGDFNPQMHKIANNLGAKAVKTHITMRKLFDPTKPFERHPILEN